MKILASALLAFALVGCASAPQNPQQAVYQSKSAYQVALTGAVTYKRLAPCSAIVKQPCSDAKVVDQLRKADNTAIAALDAAETAVRTPGFGADIQKSALVAAQAALSAFTAIVANLGAK